MDPRVAEYLRKKLMLGEEPEVEPEPFEVLPPVDLQPTARPGPTPDQLELAEADRNARETVLASGLGRAGQMFAQAFGAKNADPGHFDAMAMDANKRRDLVAAHMKEKMGRNEAQKASEKAALEAWARQRLGVKEDRDATQAYETTKTAGDQTFDLTKQEKLFGHQKMLKEMELGGERDKAAATAAAEAGKKGFKNASDLRDEYNKNPAVKEFRTITNAYGDVKRNADIAAKSKTGTGDIALVYSFIKMLDPGSAVKEGEIDMQKAASGPAAQYLNLWTSVTTGKPLTPGQRGDIVGIARGAYENRKGAMAQFDEYHKGLARKYGIPEDEVIPSLGAVVDTPGPSGPARVTSEGEYNALPSGAQYVGPDGQTRQKK
jgi:hypothetical protein